MIALETCDDDLTEVRNVSEQQSRHSVFVTSHAKRFDLLDHLGFWCISNSDILPVLLLSSGDKLSAGIAARLVLHHIPDGSEEWIVFLARHDRSEMFACLADLDLQATKQIMKMNDEKRGGYDEMSQDSLWWKNLFGNILEHFQEFHPALVRERGQSPVKPSERHVFSHLVPSFHLCCALACPSQPLSTTLEVFRSTLVCPSSSRSRKAQGGWQDDECRWHIASDCSRCGWRSPATEATTIRFYDLCDGARDLRFII